MSRIRIPRSWNTKRRCKRRVVFIGDTFNVRCYANLNPINLFRGIAIFSPFRLVRLILVEITLILVGLWPIFHSWLNPIIIKRH